MRSERTRIKICGVTRVEDALAAARHGADAIGMIFHEASARNVSESAARGIVNALPPFVTPVGVFVDAPLDEMIRLSVDLSLHVVQLNGDYDISDLAALAGTTVKVILAVPAHEPSILNVRGLDRSWVMGVVLETAGTGVSGGSGVENNWQLVRRHQELGTFNDAPPIIAAGGLTPENVGDVIRSIRPWAVDVSSGVESSKGIKSEEKIAAFCRAVRFADAAT
jgi:phosphoribosylanthranilate isomerase